MGLFSGRAYKRGRGGNLLFDGNLRFLFGCDAVTEIFGAYKNTAW